MTAPIRSRLLDFLELESEPDPHSAPEPRPRPSRLLEIAGATPAPRAPADGRPGPRPGVPPYDTPVCVPAHPRSVVGTGQSGRPARLPFVCFELFEHPAHGTVALAFTSPAKLAASLGDAQPWVASSLGPLAEGMAERGVTVLLDPRTGSAKPHWRPEDLAAFVREVRR